MFQEMSQCPSCGHGYSPSPTGPLFCTECRFPLKLVAQKYRLLAPIAEGGFGTIYRAAHVYLENDRERAVKVLKAHVLQSPENIERFYREVRVTMSLSHRNEHIVRIYDDFGQDEHLGFFYVMEHLRGRPLSALLGRGGLPVKLTLEIAWQVCDAIATCHRASVVHRDLKPENIFLAVREGQEGTPFVKVLDFGIAKTMATTQNPGLTQGILGTPIYMAPEQAEGSTIGPGADIYALGIILYEMLAGMPPFGYPSSNLRGAFMEMLRAHTSEQPPPLLEKRPDIPRELAGWVDQMLFKDPDERPASMEMLRDAFRSLLHRHKDEMTAEQALSSAGAHTEIDQDAVSEDMLWNRQEELPSSSASIAQAPHSSGASLIVQAPHSSGASPIAVGQAPVSSEKIESKAAWEGTSSSSGRLPALSLASPKAQQVFPTTSPRASSGKTTATPKAQPALLGESYRPPRPKRRWLRWGWGMAFLLVGGVIFYLGPDEVLSLMGLQDEHIPVHRASQRVAKGPLSKKPPMLPSPDVAEKNTDTPSDKPSTAKPSTSSTQGPSPRSTTSFKATPPRLSAEQAKPVQSSSEVPPTRLPEHVVKKELDVKKDTEDSDSGGGMGALRRVNDQLVHLSKSHKRMVRAAKEGQVGELLKEAKDALGTVQKMLGKPKSSRYKGRLQGSQYSLLNEAKRDLARFTRFRMIAGRPYVPQYQKMMKQMVVLNYRKSLEKLRISPPFGSYCASILSGTAYLHTGKQILRYEKRLGELKASGAYRAAMRTSMLGYAEVAFQVSKRMFDMGFRGMLANRQHPCYSEAVRRKRELRSWLPRLQEAKGRM
ncbi:MAG: protein kinase [Myxococcales bacterium]|nr:protein kinase [Myxococcales bacterium]